MTSKCGKSKNVDHEAIAECVTDVLTPFDVFCDLLLAITEQTATWDLSVYITKKQKMLMTSSMGPPSSNRQ